jgi:hypothetical protein
MEQKESLEILNKCLSEIQNMSQEEFDKRNIETGLEKYVRKFIANEESIESLVDNLNDSTFNEENT